MIKQILNFLLSFLTLKDASEILILSGIVYYFSLWLKQDKQKNLIIYFYIYCISYFSSYYFDLPILNSLLLSCAPVMILLFIIFHQNTLQKRFISLKKVVNPQIKQNLWIRELVKCCLIALNKSEDIVYIVQREDQIDNILKTSFKFYSDIDFSIFEILLEKHIKNDNYMIWFNQEAKLVAISTNFNISLEDELLDFDLQEIKKWKQKAVFVTLKTDAIVFKSYSKSRTFDIIIQGKIAESVSSDQLLKVLEAQLNTVNTVKNKNKQENTKNLNSFKSKDFKEL